MKECNMMSVELIEKALRDKLGRDMEREKWDVAAHECLAAILTEKWQGKKLNARIAEQFKERFIPAEGRDKAVVYYSREHGQTHLLLWGIGPYPDHSRKLWMFLAHDTEPTEPKYQGHYMGRVNVAGFEYGDCCHGSAAKERNKARFELCQNGGLRPIAEAIAAEISARELREKLTEHGTPGAQITYAARDLAAGKEISE